MMTVISSYAVADDSSPAVRRCRKSSVRAGRATTPGAADKNDRLDNHPTNKGNHVTFMIQPTMEQMIVFCWWSTSFPSINYYLLQQWRRISRKHKNNGRRQQQQGLPRVTVCGKLPNGARGRNAWWYLMSADNNSNRSFCEERCPYISRMPQLLDFI